MGAKRLTLCFLLILPACLAAGEDNYSISKIHFLPPVYYVGDEVEARIRLSVSGGVVPAEPSELPAPGWIRFRDVRIIPISNEYEVRISFSVYKTGTQELPPISLGDITLTGVKVGAASLLEDGVTKIEDAFGPVLLPGTRLLLAAVVGGAIVVPALIIVVFIWARRLIGQMRAQWLANKPLKDLNAMLDRLADPDYAGNSRNFYITLTETFRDYLSSRLEVDIKSHTASELKEDLMQALAGVAQVEKISAELPRFDEIKFGGLGVKRPQRTRDIKWVRDAVAAIEEWKLKAAQHVDS